MSRKSPNPNKIPRTQADVDRAYQRGVLDGSNNAAVIMMSALLDKFNAADWMVDIWNAFSAKSRAVLDHDVTIADLRCVLREEYDLDI